MIASQRLFMRGELGGRRVRSRPVTKAKQEGLGIHRAPETTPARRHLQPCDYGTCHSKTPLSTTPSRVYEREPSASAARSRTVLPALTPGTAISSVELAATTLSCVSVPPESTKIVTAWLARLVTLSETSAAAAGVACSVT